MVRIALLTVLNGWHTARVAWLTVETLMFGTTDCVSTPTFGLPSNISFCGPIKTKWFSSGRTWHLNRIVRHWPTGWNNSVSRLPTCAHVCACYKSLSTFIGSSVAINDGYNGISDGVFLREYFIKKYWKTSAVSTTDGWLKLNFASCVIPQTRSLGALVLCSMICCVTWCLWISSTIRLLILCSTSFMAGRSRVFYMYSSWKI